MTDRKTLGVAGWYGASAAVAIGGAMAMTQLLPKGAALNPAASTIAYAVLIAAALALGGQAWRRTDETAREAHKAAWFWGGSFGALAGFIGLAALAQFQLRAAIDAGTWTPGSPPQGVAWGMMVGAGFLILAQGLGYALVWAGWWLKRR